MSVCLLRLISFTTIAAGTIPALPGTMEALFSSLRQVLQPQAALLVLAPVYPSVPLGTSQGDTWNCVKLLIPGPTTDLLKSHWSGNTLIS